MLEAYARLGSVKAVARELGMARGTVQYHLARGKVRDRKPLSAGRLDVVGPTTFKPHRKGVRRYILTCAQNNTPINRQVWDNLQALAGHYGMADTDLLCASFTYNKNAYGQLSVKRNTRSREQDVLWYDEALRPYLDRSDKDIELAPGLVWCGRMNTLPTDSNPLAGFETYTGRKSGILPHAQLAMRSVASAKADPAKFNYTTGTITQRNYIQKRAGIRAEFHHTYGALLVEVTHDGCWYVRQLNADRKGDIYDLDVQVSDGKVTTGHRLEAITWGDVHVDNLDPDVREVAWGKDGMLDTLRPRYQFFHDVLDFRSRNHHDRRNPHRMFERYIEGRDNVADEVRRAAEFLTEARRDWCQSVVVDSNHDNAMDRWLRESDYRDDPRNALFFLRAQLAKYEAIHARNSDFHTVEHTMRAFGAPRDVRFLRPDESFVLCRQRGGGIECGMHGHLGPNGTRGNLYNLARMGRRANIGHVHTAGIFEGLYAGGTCSLLDVGWNLGPSAWSHTNILTYRNGKRALSTIWHAAWRGE